MNIKELVIYLKHFSIGQIYQMVHKEMIPYKNLGKELVFDKEEIDIWNNDRLQKIIKEKEYFTMQELILYLDPPLKKTTIYQKVCEGKIPCSKKRGKFLRFSKTEIDKWDEAGRPTHF